MRRSEIGFAVFLGCFTLSWLAAGLLVFGYTPLVMRLPLLAGAFTVVMLAGVVIGLAGTAGSALHSAGVAAWLDKARLKRLLGLAGILPAANLLGYSLGLPLFLALYLALNGVNWKGCLFSAVTCGVLIELVFVRILQVSMPAPWGS